MKVPFLIAACLAAITLNAQEPAGGPFGGYSAIVLIIVLVVLFLILREVNLWYWRINERVKLQEKTNSLLQQILDRIEPNQEEIKQGSGTYFSGPVTDLNEPGAMDEVLKRFSKTDK
jgi:hypothetical protein